MNRKLTAIALIAAALLTNAGFTALGSIFNYPDVLKEPTDEILDRFREHQSSVSIWFAILAVSAALFAPIAVGIGKLRDDRWMKLAVPVGIAAAVVQTIGLLRWPLLVPGFASDAASTNRDHGRQRPRPLRHRAHDPRHRDRRDLRIPPHRRLDPARRRQPRDPLRRTGLRRARNRLGSHDRPRGVLPVGPRPSSTPSTSPATSCGASG